MRTNGNHREAGTEIQTAAAITANHDPAGILREIFRQLGGIEITRRRGARFSFRFYLTKSMEETTIDSLELSVRSNNSLKRAGYGTIGQLAEAVAGEADVLQRIRSCGKKSAEEIMVRLFVYQYYTLPEDRREAYLRETLLLNLERKQFEEQLGRKSASIQ